MFFVIGTRSIWNPLVNYKMQRWVILYICYGTSFSCCFGPCNHFWWFESGKQIFTICQILKDILPRKEEYIENNTPLAFIFDWGVSYWPRAYDKEHPFAWGLAFRLRFCPRALARGQKRSLKASLKAKGCSFSLGTRSIWYPPRSKLKCRGALFFILHPHRHIKESKY